MTFDAGDNVHVLQRQVPAHHEAALPHAAPAQGQPCTLRQQAYASQGTTASSRYSLVRQFRGTLQITAVLRIQIRIRIGRIHMFLGLMDPLMDPHPDLLVTNTVPYPFIIKQ
jgi:hypothetical protein